MKNKFKDLNPKDQELLQSVLDTQLEDLTEEQVGILRARRSYLNASQLEEFDSVLNEDAPSDGKDKSKSPNSMTTDELREEAERLGIEVTEDMKHKEILRLVKEAQ